MLIKVDTRGKVCPLPLIMFRQALKQNQLETEFEILTDNETACGNLSDFICQSGFSVEKKEYEGYTSLKVNTKGKSIPSIQPQQGSEVSHPLKEMNSISIVQLRSDVMGQGEDQLGEILILAYLNALNEVESLPSHIICYNRGIRLATKSHPANEALKKLAEKGVEIILCGTCTDYFKQKEEIAVGKISNMLVIADLLSRAAHIVTP